MNRLPGEASMRPCLVIAVVGLLGCGNGSVGDGGGAGGTSAVTTEAATTGNVATTATSASSTQASTSASAGGSGPSNDSKCATAGLAICESFEGASVGGFPVGWGARGDEWGDGEIGATDTASIRGTHSLHVHGGSTGQRFMDYKGDLGGLASSHYGRVFLKVAAPAPVPASGVLHGDFIEGLGPHPGGGTNNVRWGTVENTNGKFQWIYNVQPSQGENEFGEGTGYTYTWPGAWQCLQWHYDEPSQTGSLTIDGMNVPIVPGTSHAAEIPVFTSLGVGFANYQDAGAGFELWFDELAYDPMPITCDQ